MTELKEGPGPPRLRKLMYRAARAGIMWVNYDTPLSRSLALPLTQNLCLLCSTSVLAYLLRDLLSPFGQLVSALAVFVAGAVTAVLLVLAGLVSALLSTLSVQALPMSMHGCMVL
jgi:hypothetical protein